VKTFDTATYSVYPANFLALGQQEKDVELGKTESCSCEYQEKSSKFLVFFLNALALPWQGEGQ